MYRRDERRACEKAIKFVVRFSSGRDLVEEFVAAGIWPLDRNMEGVHPCGCGSPPLQSLERRALSLFQHQESQRQKQQGRHW